MDDGSVILVEMFGPRLTRVRPDGSRHTIAELAGGPNGAAIGPDGAVYVCNNGGCFSKHELGKSLVPGALDPAQYRGGRIQRIDLATGSVEDLYTACDGQPLAAPNDLVFDAHGGFYFTDHGTRTGPRFPTLSTLAKIVRRVAFESYGTDARDLTALYYAKADGSRIERVVPAVHAPNGVGLSPDGKSLYWAETINGRVCRRTIATAGKLLPDEDNFVLCSLPGVQMLDSLALDGAGNVCVATLINGGITVIDPNTGEVLDHVPTHDRITTNICFGGSDLCTAFITLGSSGKLVSCAWPRPGLKLSYTA